MCTDGSEGWEKALAGGEEMCHDDYGTLLARYHSESRTLVQPHGVAVSSRLEWVTASAPGWATASELPRRRKQEAWVEVSQPALEPPARRVPTVSRVRTTPWQEAQKHCGMTTVPPFRLRRLSQRALNRWSLRNCPRFRFFSPGVGDGVGAVVGDGVGAAMNKQTKSMGTSRSTCDRASRNMRTNESDPWERAFVRGKETWRREYGTLSTETPVTPRLGLLWNHTVLWLRLTWSG